jgi:hypothetical protein
LQSIEVNSFLVLYDAYRWTPFQKGVEAFKKGTVLPLVEGRLCSDN